MLFLRASFRLLIGGAYLLSLTLNNRGLVEGIGRQEISDLVMTTSSLLTTFASKHLQPTVQASFFQVAFILQHTR